MYKHKKKTDSHESEPKPPNRIGIIMQEKGKDIRYVADYIGVEEETVRRYIKSERGITHGKFVQIAKALDCEPYELIIDPQEILDKKAGMLGRHLNIIEAYFRASDRDRQIVDAALFGLRRIENEISEDAKKNG